MTGYIGKIGNLEFVSGKEAFKKAADAQREGRYGKVAKDKPRQARKGAASTGK